MELGSDFIAEVRIAWNSILWIAAPPANPDTSRFFDSQRFSSTSSCSSGGSADSIVNEHDNADLEAFSGPVILRVSGAQHGNVQRLEPEFALDPEARWALFS